MGRQQLAKDARGFMTRLGSDVKGATLAMMAAALIPLAGMVGGGIDLARMYITKTRLQHACDAGALAGRKAMGGGQWNQDDGRPNATARTFFAANYKTGSFGSTDLTYAFSESAGKVTGTASAELPMTLTRVIGFTTTNIPVTCQAEMRLPNTDVMFVLDNTGSMNDKAIKTDTQTKLEALKSSVKCFYEILARLDTTEVCTGDAPSGGTSSEVQIRFGFVPYDMNVNVGKLLPSSYFLDHWTYQSRVRTTVTGVATGGYTDPAADKMPAFGNWSGNKTQTGLTSEQACKDANNETAPPATTFGTWSGSAVSNSEGVIFGTADRTGPGIQTGSGTWLANRSVTETKRKFISWNPSGNKCIYQTSTRSWTRSYDFNQAADGVADGVVFNAWIYKPVDFDFSALKDGEGWKADYKYPGPALNSATSNYTWDGCIEERETVRRDSYSPIPSGAYDLDIDSAPNSDATRWKPALDDITFPRRETYSASSPLSMGEIKTFNSYSKGYDCVLQSQPLTTWPDATTFETYVDSMKPLGNTYHDIGLLWGARLLSPTGMWKETNEYTPKGGQIQRHLIFMTDGDACTTATNYQAYGIAWFDRRQTDPSVEPTDGCTSNTVPGTLTDQVDARTQALCTAVKNMKDTTLWVIWFGAKSTKIEGKMTACASPDRFFAARDSASLQTTFRQIANQISQLRVTN